jgi:hypothetical protein
VRLLKRTTFEPNTGCWLWMGNLNHKGYGQIGEGAHSMVATHRVSYAHYKGEIPSGMQVLHACDVPSCCNPEHLWLGTHQDNVDDKMRKGRHVAGRHTKSRGSNNGNSKLAETEARAIKFGRMSYAETAKTFGVSKSLVFAIRKGKAWKHLAEFQK